MVMLMRELHVWFWSEVSVVTNRQWSTWKFFHWASLLYCLCNYIQITIIKVNLWRPKSWLLIILCFLMSYHYFERRVWLNTLLYNISKVWFCLIYYLSKVLISIDSAAHLFIGTRVFLETSRTITNRRRSYRALSHCILRNKSRWEMLG